MNDPPRRGNDILRTPLPVDKYKRSILYLLEEHDVLVVVGETGSGKSTRIPEILLCSGAYNPELKSSRPDQDGSRPKYRQICVTQPRRVAASHLAARVSQEIGRELGSIVGYAIRFTNVSSDETRLKFMTEGLLLRELLSDPLLERYSVIMVDEVHERNLESDILLGLLKCVLNKRNDLKLIICSATMDIQIAKKFFTMTDREVKLGLQEPAVLSIEGNSYPIQIYHKENPVANYLVETVETIIDIHESNRLASGKILAFLTGQDEVEKVCDELENYSQTSSSRLELRNLIILPLYASLKSEEISKVFDEYGKNDRVCIISTNIAETSLTINNVAFVVDCGFTKLKMFDCDTGIDSLVRVPISKSSAKQRAGRAGRTRKGFVYRLYREEDYEALSDETLPEIQRSSLVEPIMLLKSLGVNNPETFPLMSRMPRDNLVSGLELLNALGAIDEAGQLTSEGELIAQMYLDPKLAKLLLHSSYSQCSKEACKIVAMLQMKDIFAKPKRGSNSLWSNESLTKICVVEGDLLSYLNILNGFIANEKSQRWAERRSLNYQKLLNAVEITARLETKLKHLKIDLASSNRLETIQKSIVAGLFSNLAYLHPSGDYKTIRGDRVVHIHPTSIFSEMINRPKLLVFAEIMNTTKAFMRHIIAVDQRWILDAAPHFYTFATELEMNRER